MWVTIGIPVSFLIQKSHFYIFISQNLIIIKVLIYTSIRCQSVLTDLVCFILNAFCVNLNELISFHKQLL